MTRQRFDMVPEFYLEVGPDRFHTARMGPLRPGELFEVLGYVRFDALRTNCAQDAAVYGAFGGYVEEAVHEWNSMFSEEEGDAYTPSWKWLGISVKAQCGELDVWVNRLEGEKGVCTVYVDQGAISSAALDAAGKAMAILAEVVTKPGGDR